MIKPLVALYFAEIKEEPETVSWLPCDYQKLYVGRAEKDQGIRCSHLLPLNPTNLPLETETNPCKRSSLSSKEAIKGENLLIFFIFSSSYVAIKVITKEDTISCLERGYKKGEQSFCFSFF